MSNEKKQCPEFPFFGANYPDATCIDGYLWDLDHCNGDGQLYSTGDNPPCPFCNIDAFIEDHYGDFDDSDIENPTEEQMQEIEADAKRKCRESVMKLHAKHNYKP